MRAYLEIEGIRFEEKLEVALDIQPEASAIRCRGERCSRSSTTHSSTAMPQAESEALQIRVQVRTSAEGVALSVYNSGSLVPRGRHPQSLGIGLANIQQQLAIRYGDRGGLELVEEDGVWARVVVSQRGERVKGTKPYRALLVDDERLARRRLHRLLKAHEDRVEVVAEASSVNEAVSVLDAMEIDVVFLDVQMPGKNGFELFEACNVACEVIFVTAFDTHAVRAFEVNALDYLVKPVSPERLTSCLKRLGTARQSTSRLREDDRICVEMDRGQSSSRCVRSWRYTQRGTTPRSYSPMGRRPWTRREACKPGRKRLDASHYLRIHRSAIVRLSAIERLEKSTPRDVSVHIAGQDFPVSRRVVAELRPPDFVEDLPSSPRKGPGHRGRSLKEKKYFIGRTMFSPQTEYSPGRATSN